MNSYRLRRNVEASLIDSLSESLAEDFDNIRLTKSFSKVYKGTLPCICVQTTSRPIKRKELGSTAVFNDIVVEFRIFATSDGLRLDLADWFMDEILSSFDYFEYTITSGEITEKLLNGRINLLKVTEDTQELKNTENLVDADRYRHLIRATFRVSKITS